MPEVDNVEALAKELKEKFNKKHDQVREIAEKAIADAKASGEMSASIKEKADEALVGISEVKEQLGELDQKMASRLKGIGGPDREKSLGEQFVEDEKVKSFLDQTTPRGRVDVTTKATITSTVGTSAGNAGAGLVPTYLPGIRQPFLRPLRVRDLIMPGRMDGASLIYVKETGFTNAAANVAEGAAKPQSDIKLAQVTTSAKVIAHYAKASRQILDDIPQLQSYIDGRLRYGLKFVEDVQLLNGDGTGQNLLGIVPQSTAYSAPITLASPTSIDLARLAILQVYIANVPASGIVMHPSDWAFIETMKDTLGRYIIGDPQQVASPRLWGLPVVETQAMAVDSFLVGAFELGAQLFDRWQARVEIATENEDDFIKNLITMLCEERLALAVYRPEAFVLGDFGRVA